MSDEKAPPLPVTVRTAGRLGGFDVEFSATLDVRRVQGLVAWLRKIGVEPPPRPLRFETTPDGQPVCPKHGVPMKRREKQGDEWHSHKLVNGHGEEVFCRGYPGPDSPGYAVDLGPA